MSLTPKKILLLRMFVDRICEECHKHEEEVGTLEPHKINQNIGYILRNIKMVCSNCHKIFNSAQRIAIGVQS